jgi:hypothetical protein
MAEKPSAPKPKYITYRMRCGRTILVLDTPEARINAKRMGWTEVIRR